MRKSLKDVLRPYTPNFRRHQFLHFVPKDCVSVLDLGCGDNSVAQYLPSNISKTAVDAFSPALEISRKKNLHDNYLLADVRSIDAHFKSKTFDCVMAIDLIEHLKKDEAIQLIEKMERISKKIVILETSAGYLKQDSFDGNPMQEHLCGFTCSELRNLGYTVYGSGGPWFMRVRSDGSIRRLNVAGAILASLLEPVFQRLPQYSFLLFAYKETSGL